MITDCDLAGMLEQSGVPVVVGGKQTFGIVRHNDLSMLSEEDAAPFVGDSISVTLRTVDVEEVAIGGPIEIDGTEYSIRKRLRIVTGNLSKVWCVLP